MLKLISLKYFFIVLLYSSSALYAGAWPIGKGKGFFQLTSKVVSSDKYYTPGGDLVTIPRVLDVTNSVYGEMGLFKNISLTVNSTILKYWSLNELVIHNPGLNLYQRSPGQEVVGAGDTEFGVRYGLYRNTWIRTSVSLGFGFPTSNWKQRKNIRKFNKPNGSVLNEDGAVFEIPVGANDYPISLTLNLDIVPFKILPLEIGNAYGFKNRTLGPGSRGYSDIFFYSFKLGYPWKSTFFIVSAFGEKSLENGVNNKDASYIAFGPQIYSRVFKNIGVILGFDSATNNKNTLSALAYKGGFYLSY